MTIAKILSPNLPIDPVVNFTPIVHIGGPPFVVVSIQPRQPLAKLSDLRQPPAPVTYGSPGYGTLGHILCAAISQGAHLPLLHVPYSKSMLPDLLGGHLDLGCISLPTVASLIAEGRLFPLVIAGSHRRRELPGVPALAELGQEEIPAVAWLAVLGPARLPSDIVSKLNTAFVTVLADPLLGKMLKLELADPLPMSSGELARQIRVETALWRPIMARLRLRP